MSSSSIWTGRCVREAFLGKALQQTNGCQLICASKGAHLPASSTASIATELRRVSVRELGDAGLLGEEPCALSVLGPVSLAELLLESRRLERGDPRAAAGSAAVVCNVSSGNRGGAGCSCMAGTEVAPIAGSCATLSGGALSSVGAISARWDGRADSTAATSVVPNP